MSERIHTGLTPRTIAELQLYGQLHPCTSCGAAEWTTLEVELRGPTERIYAARCRGCDAQRRYEVDLPPDWDDRNTLAVPSSASTLIGPDEFLIAADDAEAAIVARPAELSFDEYFRAYGGFGRLVGICWRSSSSSSRTRRCPRPNSPRSKDDGRSRTTRCVLAASC